MNNFSIFILVETIKFRVMAEKVLKSFSEEEKKKITEIQSKVLSITSRLGEIEIGLFII